MIYEMFFSKKIVSPECCSQKITPGGPVVECLPGALEVVGSNPGWVIPQTLKMVLGAWHLKVTPRKYGPSTCY